MENDLVLGGPKSRLEYPKFNPVIQMKKIYVDFNLITIKFNELECIDNNIWFPSESDKNFMSQSAYDEALKIATDRKNNLLFSNVSVEYETCDCSDGMCSHGRWPYEINIQDGKKHHIININDKESISYHIKSPYIDLSLTKEDMTYGDLIRFCKLCNIPLLSDKYILPEYK